MEKKNKKQKVFVAMSGGVDSSVAAALLKQGGYDVAGVFMRLGKSDLASEKAAKLVAEKLGLEFLIFDFKREFKKIVVSYFLKELKNGRTPNPCVVCNPQIKFGLFLEKAIKMGADYIATGHYAKIKKAENIYKLFQAKDKIKDQSYFLYRLNQRQLSKIIFPLGNLLKSEVYKLAKKIELPYRQGESFDICFVDDYRGFLKKYLKMKSGKIIDSAGHILDNPAFAKATVGTHQGVELYTLGQRASVGGRGPFYVVKKDNKNNILYVSNEKKDLYQKETLVEKVNWLGRKLPKLPFRCGLKIRYNSKVEQGAIRANSSIKNGLRVLFDKPQWAPTSGQSAVFYSKNGEVLGGGIMR